MCKVNRHVQFPQLLDLAPYCSVNCKVSGFQDDLSFFEMSLSFVLSPMNWGHYIIKVQVSCNVVVLIESIVLFGGTLLRLAFFLCQQNVSEGKTQVLYSLYGIVEHSGTMRSGHYTAYVKTRPNRQSMAPNGLAMQGRHFNFSVWSGVCYCVRNCTEVQLGNIHPICL